MAAFGRLSHHSGKFLICVPFYSLIFHLLSQSILINKFCALHFRYIQKHLLSTTSLVATPLPEITVLTFSLVQLLPLPLQGQFPEKLAYKGGITSLHVSLLAQQWLPISLKIRFNANKIQSLHEGLQGASLFYLSGPPVFPLFSLHSPFLFPGTCQGQASFASSALVLLSLSSDFYMVDSLSFSSQHLSPA